MQEGEVNRWALPLLLRWGVFLKALRRHPPTLPTLQPCICPCFPALSSQGLQE